MQIVVEEEQIERVRSHAARLGASMSWVIRRALDDWLARQEPDTSWIGALHVGNADADDDWEAVRRSIARGMGR